MGWRWITLVLLLVGVAPARGQTPPAPDPAPTGYTDRDYDADALALERAFSVEVYRNADRRAAAWDEAVIALLDDYAKLWAETSDRPNWTKFGQRGTRLLEDGCDDPLVQMAVGQALHRTNSINRTRRLMLSAIDRLEEHGYPAVWRARAGRLVAHYMRVWEKPAEAAEQHRKAVYALFESLRRNEFGDGGKRFFHADLDAVIEDLVPSDATALIERVRADDTIDPWIAACAQSLCFLHIGWEARGTGWARGVTEEQWAVFEVNLTEAVTHLSRAWEIDPTCPEPAVAMMSIGRAGHLPPDEDMWLWFDRARAAQFDWMPAYDQMLERLRPRWGGSLDEMYAFGMACMNTERYDTMVPFMLVTTIVDIGTDAESFSFLEDPGIYPSAREVVDRYVERPDRSGVRGWFASTGAAIAWAAGQHEDCLRYLELVEFKPFTSRLKVFDTTPREVIDDAVLYGSRIGPAVLRAEEAIDAGDVAAGMRGYEEALEVAGDDERIAGIVRDRIVATELLRGFMAGDWVPLRFRPGLPGWRVVEGVWQEISETAILAGPNSDGLKLLCLTPFGRRFEMRGVIDLRGLEKARGRRLNAGVYFAYAPERTRYTWQTLLLYRPSDWSQVGPRLDWRRAERFQLPRKKHHRYEFHLQVWDSEVIVTVDGEVVCTGTLGDDGEDRPLGDLIGLGGAYAEMCGFARFEDFAIRRLAGRPETTGTDP